jgi:hypothetical protein
MSKRSAATATKTRHLYSFWLDLDLKRGLERLAKHDRAKVADEIRWAIVDRLTAKGILKEAKT